MLETLETKEVIYSQDVSETNDEVEEGAEEVGVDSETEDDDDDDDDEDGKTESGDEVDSTEE